MFGLGVLVGSALTSEGKLQLTLRRFKTDFGPLDPRCDCMTCTTYSRAALHAIAAKEAVCKIYP